MKVEYSERAVADLRKVSGDSLAFGEAVAASVEARIRRVVAHIAEHPEAAQQVVERRGVRSCRCFGIRTKSSTGCSMIE